MNRYTRVKVLGKGSFGSAILCRPKDNPNDQCVIKEINLGGYSSGQRREALNEIKVLQALQHPNIVSYRDSFEEGKKLYIVMEYASGGDLYKYMKRHPGGIGEDQALDFFVQICLALKHMHDRKILHRDLKTMNIFLGKDNMVKLGDFGISRVMRNTMEMARTKCGTPYYFSPELCQGRGYNNKTDVWSLGVVLYELATGRTPFDANNMNALIAKIIRGTYPALSSRHSSQMKQLVADCFQREPRNRPSINQILKKEYIRNRIAKFLDEKLHQEEFSHTVLHGQHFDKARPAAGPSSRPNAAPVARPAPGSAAVPAGVAPGAGMPVRPGMVQMNRPISAERRNVANVLAAGKPSGVAPAGRPSNAAAAVAAPFAGAAAGRMPRAYLLGNQQNKDLANDLKRDYKCNFGGNRAEELRKLADNLKNKNKDPNAKPAGDVHAEIYAAKKARDEQREKEREKERREREREFREREQKYRERKEREDRERRRREEEAAAKLEREREERRQKEKAERERRRKDERERELQREREAAERQRQRVQRDLEEAAKRDDERRRELQRIKEARERRIEEERRQREEQRKVEMERKARERKEELERKRIEEERLAKEIARAEREAADRKRMLEKWNEVSTTEEKAPEAPMPQKPYPAAKEDWQGMLANQMAGMQKMLNNHKDKHPTLRKPMEDDSFLASMLPKPAYDDNQYRAEPASAKRSPKSEVASPSDVASRDRDRKARVVGAEKKSPAQPVFEVKKQRELPAKKAPVSPAAQEDEATKKALQDRKETRERERAKFKQWVDQQKKLGGADSSEQGDMMVVHTPGGAVEMEAAKPIDEAELEAANERRHQAEFSYMLGDLITIVEESDSNPSTPSDENFGDSDEEDSAEDGEDSESPAEEPVVKENLDHNSMTQALFTGMLTIGKKNKFKLDAVSRKDSLFHRIEALRQYLETELGDDAMIDAYRLAKNATENDDDDEITERMAKRMGEKNRGLIPHVYQLLVLEEIFERS